MPGFQENLLGIGTVFDADYSVIFCKDTVIIYSPKGHTVLTGWREAGGPHLWRISLLPDAARVHEITTAPDAQQSTLEVFSAYDLPIV